MHGSKWPINSARIVQHATNRSREENEDNGGGHAGGVGETSVPWFSVAVLGSNLSDAAVYLRFDLSSSTSGDVNVPSPPSLVPAWIVVLTCSWIDCHLQYRRESICWLLRAIYFWYHRSVVGFGVIMWADHHHGRELT